MELTLKDFFKIRQRYQEEYIKFLKEAKEDSFFKNIETHIQKLLDYDWLIQTSHNKIKEQLKFTNKQIKNLSKTESINSNLINKLMQIKSKLKDQDKSINYIREKNYVKLKNEYVEILKLIQNKVNESYTKNEYFFKLFKVLNKKETIFLKQCINWKKEKTEYYSNIYETTSNILKNGTEILIMLDKYYLEKNKSFLEVSIYSKLNNFSNQIEDFKKNFPKCNNFKNQFLQKYNPLNEFNKYIKNIHLKITFNLDHKKITNKNNKDNKDNKEQLNKEDLKFLKDKVSLGMSFFHDIFHLTKDYLNKIEKEKNYLLKMSLNQNEFEEKILLDFLMKDNNNIIYLFYVYIQEHEYS